MTTSHAPVGTDRQHWEQIARAHLDAPQSVRLVALVLATYCTYKTGANARPGLERLIDGTGTSRRTVLRALAWLQAHGWIHEVVPHRRTATGGRATEFRLTVPALLVGALAEGAPRFALNVVTGDESTPAVTGVVTTDAPVTLTVASEVVTRDDPQPENPQVATDQVPDETPIRCQMGPDQVPPVAPHQNRTQQVDQNRSHHEGEESPSDSPSSSSPLRDDDAAWPVKPLDILHDPHLRDLRQQAERRVERRGWPMTDDNVRESMRFLAEGDTRWFVSYEVTR